MFYRVNTVKIMNDFCLLISFCNGETKLYDVKPLILRNGIFNNLKLIDGLFNQVKVDIKGYGISWNNEIDISCNELFYNGETK